MMKRAVTLILVLLAVTWLCEAREIIVTSTADSGAGTLRSALQAARSGDVIIFDTSIFPPADPTTIYPRSELPPISCGNLTINASNAGVIIDGSKIPGDWYNGLSVYSSYNAVMGLQIINFAGSGLAVTQGGRHNTIGGDRGLGLGPIGQGNLSSGNGIGINLCDAGTSSNTVLGNLVGVAADGVTPWGNRDFGIFIEDNVYDNVIGPRNVIAYNKYGIVITGAGAVRNRITRNSIHGNAAGMSLWSGGNALATSPWVSDYSLYEGVVKGEACSGCVVEIFSGESDQGEHFEGETTADSRGFFAFEAGKKITGSRVTVVSTDLEGNTSGFSLPTSGETGLASMQRDSVLAKTRLSVKPSDVLEDNRIGTQFEVPHNELAVYEGVPIPVQHILSMGYKWVRLEVDKYGLWWNVDWQNARDYIPEEASGDMERLARAGVNIVLSLGTFTIDIGVHDDFGRFKNEEELRQYLAYLNYLVEHFGSYVEHFELWNEPDCWNHDWRIDLPQYVNLIQRAASAVRSNQPAVRIQAGSTTTLVNLESRSYLFDLLSSPEVAQLDAVSWHPFYGASPEHSFLRDYYYEYPSLLARIKETAKAQGFTGVFIADELYWWTSSNPDPGNTYWKYNHSPTASAKYYAHGILLHLGMNVVAEIIEDLGNQVAQNTLANLCTVMAGHEAIDMPVEIDIETDGPVAYCAFRYPSGDRMLAVWTDGIAQDEDLGVLATVTFPGLTAVSITGVDVLHGFEQELVYEIDGESAIVRDLLVKDYPILIRLSDVTFAATYEETVGDGFHRLGDPSAVPSGSGADRDGDGVPDDEDLCPDWPGSESTSGC
ncbi:hypothetical protein ACFLTM_01550 [Candidatus Bipolaricaulota bacterium]